MISAMTKETLTITCNYLAQNYSKANFNSLLKEIFIIAGIDNFEFTKDDTLYSYENVQKMLSSLNENEKKRKKNGVYYTPIDVVRFILINSIKSACGKLKPNGLHVLDLNGIPYNSFCFNKTIYDPTCGAGEFLVAALEIKLDLLDLHKANITKGNLKKIVRTIKGNDVNIDSTIITKIRLFLCALQRQGVSKVKGLGEILNDSFENYDFVQTPPNTDIKYDIIVGNPPYVEDSRSGLSPQKKYGNIYANVLENAGRLLKPKGSFGFVIPLSYISTPRMSRIREVLYSIVPEQYILSYSDRPDCLFTSVHQKLCILIGRSTNSTKTIFTGNYRYWYSEERTELFNTVEVIKNSFSTDQYIPKLGTIADINVYEKVIGNPEKLLDLLEENGDGAVYLNMRAAFWIKAFINKHNGGEYRQYNCRNRDIANYVMCLLNSSLFWWYWIAVSDCWHITRKELIGFTVPENNNFNKTNRLAKQLEDKLEETKKFVGTKQTDYEYKHKECVDEIHEIDDYINSLYGLTDDESLYIKNFAFRYRIGGGAEFESD
ncbi:MAG: N-6 DNA methylase [Epulopiscium sp.]|nr:N-6 DNA methylase [Tissierellia bacterium]NLJ88823.1 N-6 DNA methylase [Candidatus Epulonipiscium sp.]